MDEVVEVPPASCPGCGRPLVPPRPGWSPCSCPGAGESGGHRTYRHDRADGGCGHVVQVGHVGPPPAPDRLPDFGQGSGPHAES